MGDTPRHSCMSQFGGQLRQVLGWLFVFVAIVVAFSYGRAVGGSKQIVNVTIGAEQFSVEAAADTTIGAMASKLASLMNLDKRYIVIYEKSLPVAAYRNEQHPTSNLLWSDGVRNMASKPLSALLSTEMLGLPAISVKLRPLRGDHVHMAVGFWYKGRRIARNVDSPVLVQPSEGEHIRSVMPHFGVHAGNHNWFNDSLIHIHPGTSWQWFEGTEGAGCTFGAYLEQIGAHIWEPDSKRYPSKTPHEDLNFTAPHALYVDLLGDILEGSPDCSYTDTGRVLLRSSGRETDPWEQYSPRVQVVPNTGQVLYNFGEYATGHTIVTNTHQWVWRMYVYSHHQRGPDLPTCVLHDRLERVLLRFNGGVLGLVYEPLLFNLQEHTVWCRERGKTMGAECNSARHEAGWADIPAEFDPPFHYPFPPQDTIDELQRVSEVKIAFDGTGVYPLVT